MVTVELTDDELVAVRVALRVLLEGRPSTHPGRALWGIAATGLLQRLEPLVEDRT